MVYGIIVESVKDAILKNYGHEIWEQIQEYLNFNGNTIMANNIYPDSIFAQVIDALILFRQEGDHDFYMEFFGNSFVAFFSNYGFEKILRVAGRSFRDFLHSIDQLHDSNRFTFPHMQSPLFYVSKEDENGCYLHYQSRRKGFNYYVVGQLKECCRKFYNISCEIRIDRDISTEKHNHVIYRIDFDNKEYAEELESRKNFEEANLNTKLNHVMSSTLLNLFPFSLAIDKDLKIRYYGTAFETLFYEDIMNHEIYKVFDIKRPPFKVTWDDIIKNSSSIIFELESLFELKFAKSNSTRLICKGQMKLMPELNLILFLGHPVIKSMDHLSEVGLYLTDLNRFDGSAEMLVTEMQHNSQLQKAFEMQQAWTVNLETTRMQLNSWKKKGKKLLYSMLPARVAQMIENGVQPNSICETFEQVTIMFVNTADFSNIVKNAEPHQLVKFVNSTISVYDRVVGTYDKVHKIETKADGSYLIVAGLDKERRQSIDAISQGQQSMFSVRTTIEEEVQKRHFPQYNQVELICSVALEIIDNSHELHNPFTDPSQANNLKIKVGFHTGSIVAGIVGLSNIQFCLFGDTVNTASRMCSNSEPGRVLFSDDSYKILQNSKYFDSEFRDMIQVKGKGSMKTYWLKGKKNGY